MSVSRSCFALLAISSLILFWAGGASSAPSAEGGLIAFESDRPDGINASFDVFTMDANGSAVTQLTDGSGFEPAWDAAGTLIAFGTQGTYGEPRACLRNIFAMSGDGTGKTWVLGGEGCSSQATSSCSFNNFPSWSPDGTRIVYAANDCFASGVRVPGGIFVVDVATRARTRLTTNEVGLALDADPSWSHDGTRIAFARADALGYHIHVMDADGGNLTQLESVGGTGPAWSPDDSRIAFGSGGIAVVDADGSNRVQVTSTVGLPPSVNDSDPEWSSDGSRIAFHSNRIVNGSGDYEIWVMNADGSSARPITDNSGIDDRRPSWQPGGGSPPPPPPPSTGTIEIELDAVPDSAHDFGYAVVDQPPPPPGGAGNLILPFSLDDDADASLPASVTLSNLRSGSYRIRQDALPPGWELTGLTCNDPDGGTSTDLDSATATIDLDPDETVACTYTNTDAVAPTLTMPIGVSVDATGPGGATVAYAVTAHDDRDPSPTVSCTPVSGSLFPIGTTDVDCTATDDTGNSSEGLFSIEVRGAGAQITALIAMTEALVVDPRVEAVLRAVLVGASQALAAGRKAIACAAMTAYVVAVRVLPTRILSAPQKSQLIADASRIRAVSGC